MDMSTTNNSVLLFYATTKGLIIFTLDGDFEKKMHIFYTNSTKARESVVKIVYLNNSNQGYA